MNYYAKRFFGQAQNEDSLVASYNFEGNTLDSSPSGLNLSLVGGANVTNDVLNVTTSGSYAQALDPTGKASFGSGAMTIACKVRVNSFASNSWIANKRDNVSVVNNSKAEWQIFFLASKLTVYLFDSSKSTTSYISASSNQTFLANTTYHIAVTFGGGVSNNFKMYVNGTLITHTFSSAGSYQEMRNNGSALRLANDGWSAGFPIKGWIDNFELYASELSASDIQILANK